MELITNQPTTCTPPVPCASQCSGNLVCSTGAQHLCAVSVPSSHRVSSFSCGTTRIGICRRQPLVLSSRFTLSSQSWAKVRPPAHVEHTAQSAAPSYRHAQLAHRPPSRPCLQRARALELTAPSLCVAPQARAPFLSSTFRPRSPARSTPHPPSLLLAPRPPRDPSSLAVSS